MTLSWTLCVVVMRYSAPSLHGNCAGLRVVQQRLADLLPNALEVTIGELPREHRK